MNTSLVLAGLLIVAWNWELAGGIIFAVLGTGLIIYYVFGLSRKIQALF